MVDLDKLPFYELHTMFYMVMREREEEAKMTEEQKGAKAFGEVLEDSM